jgi:hypothetical protein
MHFTPTVSLPFQHVGSIYIRRFNFCFLDFANSQCRLDFRKLEFDVAKCENSSNLSPMGPKIISLHGAFHGPRLSSYIGYRLESK